MKKGRFTRVIYLDASTWRIYELHCKRKHGENETRVANMKNILENKYGDDKPGLASPTMILERMSSIHNAAKQKRIFGKKLASFDGFDSNKTVDNMKENFKTMAYQKVSEIEVI